ncbi:MAG: matrixin family metalloprotease [Bacteriovoracaceae bacterium]
MKFKIINLLLFCAITLGFRTIYSKHRWAIWNGSESDRKLFVTYTNADSEIPNDLVDDVLSGTDTITVEQAMDSIFDDYNSIGASYLILVDTDDVDYTEEDASNRIIEITFNGASGLSSGEAQYETNSDGKIEKCVINMGEDSLESAKDFIQIMTHELGHCAGLAHPQDTVNAIMSYYARSSDVRLLMDDKMGLTYLYPIDAGAGHEKSTYGLSCGL